MSLITTLEFENLPLKAHIGTFDQGIDPYEHSLDLMLIVDTEMVLIDEDDMQRVFDYDPLLEHIQQVAQERHYETQEMLLTRILACCSAYVAVQGVEMCIKKSPKEQIDGHVSIGVRVLASGAELDALR